MISYYPINLVLKNKRCLVIGAGDVAERKVRRLLECGAQVLVIAPRIVAGLKELAQKKKIIFKNRRVNLADLDGVYLVIVATARKATNSLISSHCHKKGILVNVVDCPEECSFILPSVMRRGALTISISTGGISPVLAMSIRRDLKRRFGSEYGRLLRIMKEIRPEVLKKIKNSQSRKAFFQKALQPEIFGLFKQNKEKEAKRRLHTMLEDFGV